MAEPEKKAAGGTLQTLSRGIEALLLISRSPGGVKVGDIAERLGLHRAVAYRVVATLAEHGMARRLEDGRIVLGASAFLLGAKAADAVRAAARPVLEALAERTGATAFLSFADGDECVVALTVAPREAVLAVNYKTGARHPLDRGASGIAILAARAPAPGEDLQVTEARALGYSLTRGQLNQGAVGISSAVRLPDRGFGAMECSVGVVALETLDIPTACAAVPEAAASLARGFA